MIFKISEVKRIFVIYSDRVPVNRPCGKADNGLESGAADSP